MTTPVKRVAMATTCCLLLCSCGKDGAFPKRTYPVTGEIHVDGQPAAELQVYCHNADGIDAEYPTLSSAVTDENGKFEISTFESADGVPEGEYVLTFEWKEYNAFKGAYDYPDRLKRRYGDPKKSRFRFTVEKGPPYNWNRIDLSTK